MTVWYYVDHNRTRRGPVSAEALAVAYAQGQLAEDGLVWREGLAQWSPLADVRDELALPPLDPVAAAEAAFPRPSASPPAPAAAKRGSGCLIAAAVAAIGGLLVLAVLAAIAIPAYQDYVVRAKVMAAINQARAQQVLVDEFVANTDRCPRDASELALPAPGNPAVASLTLGEANTGMCIIELELSADAGSEALAGELIRLSRDSDGNWYCTSEMERRSALPADCR